MTNPAGPPRSVQDVYPLSPLQEGLLFHALYDPDSPAYFDQSIIHLRGTVDEPALVEAWQRACDRHPILRTAFAWRSGRQPLQIVMRTVPVPFAPYDWRSQPDALDEGRLTAFLEADRRQPFDMARAPLFRLSLIHRAEDDYVLVWSRHHVLLDGWSLALVLRDVLEAYAALIEGRRPPDRPAPPYRDFIDWLGRQSVDAARQFWTAHLDGVAGATPLGLAGGNRAGGEDAAGYLEVTDTIPAAETAAISACARRSGLTLNALLQGAWALCMARASGESDVVFGSTVAGRPPTLAGSESIVGLFINTLPVRVAIPGATAAVTWLREFQQQQVEARLHDYASLVAIQGWSGVPRQQPLFEALFVFENYPVDETVRADIPGLQVVSSRTFERTHYPLTLIVSPRDTIELTWIADRRRLADADLRRWMAAYRTLVRNLVQHGSEAVASISFLDAEERTTLVTTWNANRIPLPADTCLHDLFEQQAVRTPAAVALIHGAERLTYAELNDRADRLAARLRALGVSGETRVAICASRTVRVVTALLAILKAGAAYVPLDPEYPRERLAFMLEDSGAAVLITEPRHVDRLPPHGLMVVDLDEEWNGPSLAPIDRASRLSPDNLAYLIYTSGSTGRPKGTAITHRSAVALIVWARTTFRDDELARVLASTSLCFDLSVFEIFLPLAAGGGVVMADNVLELSDLPAASEITLVNTVPSAIAELVRQRPLPSSVRTIALAGEPLTTALTDRLYAQPAVDRVLDLYGPSETTTYSTWAERTPGGRATIGRPIANTTLYIVDAALEPAAIGVAGEMLLGGAGLARGYLGRPELTAERFIPDPFSGEQGARLYRTGDLARFLPGGNVEFLGRADHQVKVHGFRIELGEIQARLEEHPALAEIAVVARPHATGGLGLVAYVVPRRGDDAPSSGELRDYLAGRLPAYMIPGVWCRLDRLPRTPNGKLDRQRLPDPAALEAPRGDAVAARTAEEEILAGIWQDVLERESIGVTDNLFDLGGHSLIATRIVSRVRQVFGCDCPLRLVFEHPTIESFARAVATLSGAPGAAVEPIPSRGAARDAPLSFVQQRLWFLQQLDPANTAYNVPVVLEMTGTLDADALEASLHAIVARHETLRSAIVSDRGRPSVRVYDDAGWRMERRDLQHLAPADREGAIRNLVDEQVRAPFALDRVPLFRVMLLIVEPARYVLALTLHHVIADEWSMGVLVRDLSHAYRALAAGGQPEWTPLAIQYGDFAAWQRGDSAAPAIERQREYWRRQLDGLGPIDVPTDLERTDDRTPNGLTVSLPLSPTLGLNVRRFARREGATIYMALLAAFQVLLARYSGQTDIAVGTPIAGRTRSEVEPLVGCFLNTLVLRTHLDGRPTFRQLVARVRETTLAAYANQDVPFEELVDALGSGRDLSRHPLVQVTFALERPQALEAALPGVRIAPLRVETKTAKFDLGLVVEDEGEHLATALQVSTDLFTEATARRMLEHYRTLLEAAVGEPDVDITALPLIGERERRRMIVDWNRTAAAFAPVAHVVELFDAQVVHTPDRMAVAAGDAVTLAELDTRANRLARHLARLGILSNARVALCLNRSIDLAVAVLAVLKAGAVCVPIDPDLPVEHVRRVVEDSGAALIVTRSGDAKLVPPGPTTMVLLDKAAGDIDRESSDRLVPAIESDSLACLCYTSDSPGDSTGGPLGLAVPHSALVNFLQAEGQADPVGLADALRPSGTAALQLAWKRVGGETGDKTIGRPVANARAYILDARLQPVPAGVIGTLFLGGAGLARGYWRRTDLTAAAFVPDPFSAQLGARLYRTGYRCRYRRDGVIERVDHLDPPAAVPPAGIEVSDRTSDPQDEPAGLPVLDLPTDVPRPLVRTFRGAIRTLPIDPPLAAAVRQLARESGVPVFAATLAAFATVLHRYANQDDVPICVPGANRSRQETEGLLGLFVNTVVVRTRFAGGPTVRELVTQVADTVLRAQEHQDLPFEQLVDALQPARDLSRNPVFQVMFAHVKSAAEDGTPGAIQALDLTPAVSKFDLTLTISERGDALHAALEYNVDLFRADTAARLGGYFQRVLRAMVADREARVADLPLLDPVERETLLEGWNRTAAAPGPWPTLGAALTATALREGDRDAVLWGAERLSYRALDRRATALAERLTALGVGGDGLVGVCLPRSIALIVALAAVAKAGGAYVPLDPALPAERLALMADDADLAVLITARPVAAAAALRAGHRLYLEDDAPVAGAAGVPAVLPGPAAAVSPDQLAYVLFTSGSTGRPKGVQISHGALLNLLAAMRRRPGLSAADRLLAVTTLSFDIAALEIWLPLTTGGTVVLASSDEAADGRALMRLLAASGATVMQATPATWRLLQDAGWTNPAGVRILVGGEALPPDLARDLRAGGHPDARPPVWNLYGPTETTVWSLVHEVEDGPGAVPIGRPIANTRVYVLDDRLEPVPVNTPGQLYIGGAGLARGYLQQPALTAARFLPDPHAATPGARMYATGDVARVRHTGTIEFLGRADGQVKLHGHRIELGEIEQTLAQHPGVRQVVAARREDRPGVPQLVAYVVPTAGATLHAGALRERAARTLPDYMVPARYVVIDQVPLTPHGKIDRARLPAPEQGAASAQASVAPRTDAERQMAALWRDILAVPVVSIDDDFFEIGGDSILAIQVVARARTAGLHVTPRMIFQHRTIAALLSGAATAAAEPPAAAHRSTAAGVELTPPQRWFFELDLADPDHFNQAALLVTPPHFDFDVARRAVAALVAHHGTFSRTFQPTETGWTVSPADPSATVAVTRYTWRDQDPSDLARRLAIEQRSLDIQRGPLLRVAWLDAGPHHEGRLAIVAHHLVIDAVSWRILLDDLEALYANPAHALPEATAPPWAWAHETGSALGGPDWSAARQYWTGTPPIAFGLPRDSQGEAAANVVATEQTSVGRLTREETTALIESVAAAYRMRVDEILIAATWRACARWSGRRGVTLDVEGHGREDLPGAPDVSRSLGWFTSIFPVALDHRRSDTPDAWLVETKERLRTVPHHGAGYALLRYLDPDATLRASLAAWPPREMIVNYLGQFRGGDGRPSFAAAPEPVGDMRSPRGRRPYLLELNAGIIDGGLEVRLSYSTTFHRRTTIEAVLTDLLETIRSFIAFCRETTTPGFTASDFTEAGLSQDELTRLLARLAGT